MTETVRSQGYDPFEKHGTAPANHTDEDVHALHRWIRRALDTLGLRDWHGHLSRHEPTNGEANAEAFLRDDAREIIIAISDRWYGYPEPDRRATLTHEVLHAAFHPLTIFANEAMRQSAAPAALRLFEAQMAHEEELAVDTLAYALAQLLPAIELPSGR